MLYIAALEDLVTALVNGGTSIGRGGDVIVATPIWKNNALVFQLWPEGMLTQHFLCPEQRFVTGVEIKMFNCMIHC